MHTNSSFGKKKKKVQYSPSAFNFALYSSYFTRGTRVSPKIPKEINKLP